MSKHLKKTGREKLWEDINKHLISNESNLLTQATALHTYEVGVRWVGMLACSGYESFAGAIHQCKIYPYSDLGVDASISQRRAKKNIPVSPLALFINFSQSQRTGINYLPFQTRRRWKRNKRRAKGQKRTRMRLIESLKASTNILLKEAKTSLLTRRLLFSTYWLRLYFADLMDVFFRLWLWASIVARKVWELFRVSWISASSGHGMWSEWITQKWCILGTNYRNRQTNKQKCSLAI